MKSFVANRLPRSAGGRGLVGCSQTGWMCSHAGRQRLRRGAAVPWSSTLLVERRPPTQDTPAEDRRLLGAGKWSLTQPHYKYPATPLPVQDCLLTGATATIAS